jgi:prevent-host-death family protein
MDREASNSMGAYEAKAHFSELLERVESGEEVTITRHGHPVAKFVPVRKSSTLKERQEAVEAMLEASKGRSLRGLKIKDLIDEGRP